MNTSFIYVRARKNMLTDKQNEESTKRTESD